MSLRFADLFSSSLPDSCKLFTLKSLLLPHTFSHPWPKKFPEAWSQPTDCMKQGSWRGSVGKCRLNLDTCGAANPLSSIRGLQRETRGLFSQHVLTDWSMTAQTRNIFQSRVVSPWVLCFSSGVRYALVQCYREGREAAVLEEVTIKKGLFKPCREDLGFLDLT